MALGVIVLIVYGSLYPFGFHPCAFSFPALLHTSATPSSRGDLLSNILLYVPLGFFAARSVRSWHRAIPAASALGVALSFLVEMTQECVLSRVPSMADVIANGAGALIGSLLAVALRSNYSALLIACWIGSRLFPYLPSPHVEKYSAAIRAVMVVPEPKDLFRYFALWLAAAVVLGRRVELAIVVVLIARIVIVEDTLTLAEILGALLAAIAARLLSAERLVRAAAAVVTLFVIASALEPFHFLARPRSFGWIPFLSFMLAPREAATQVFLEKSFIYGALVWLPVRAGLRIGAVAPVVAALVFALRVIQIYLPGRSAEVTDALMVLMMAVTMNFMRA
jgi:VanZ family protein